MASGWTESGIDWDNLSTQSPRDVIRELYIAVSERDFWVKYFGTGGYNSISDLSPIDYDVQQRHRTKEQIDFILSSINSWLSDTTSFYISGTPIESRSGVYRGCFIDYEQGSNYSFDGYGIESKLGYDIYRNYSSQEELALGYKSFSSLEGGNTEILINGDLSFLRDYNLGVSFRFTHEMMHSIYKILNNLKFVRATQYTKTTVKNPFNNIFSNVYFTSEYYSDNSTRFSAQISQGFPITTFSNFNDARDYLYNKKFGRTSGIDGTDAFEFQDVPVIGGGENWRGYTLPRVENSFLRFENRGYNDEIFRTEDFDLKSLTYGINFQALPYNPNIGEREILPPDYTLNSRPSGHNIYDNNIVDLFNENTAESDIDLNYQGKYWAVGYGNLKTGDIPDSVGTSTPNRGQFVTQYLPLINFNKEGFLKYYTEPTN